MKTTLRLALLVPLLATARPAPAQNLARDGDLEAATGTSGTLQTFANGQSFDGFFTVAIADPGGIVGIDTDDGFQISGHKSAFLFHGGIVQSLATPLGGAFSIAFDTMCGVNGAPSFQIGFGAVTQSVTAPNGPAHFVLAGTATAPTTSLSFASTLGDPVELDNVVVTLANPTPEPPAVAALGLGAVALLRRRRKA